MDGDAAGGVAFLGGPPVYEFRLRDGEGQSQLRCLEVKLPESGLEKLDVVPV